MYLDYLGFPKKNWGLESPPPWNQGPPKYLILGAIGGSRVP